MWYHGTFNKIIITRINTLFLFYEIYIKKVLFFNESFKIEQFN